MISTACRQTAGERQLSFNFVIFQRVQLFVSRTRRAGLIHSGEIENQT